VLGSLITSSLCNHCSVKWWKNFENWSTFAEVTDKNQVSCFASRGRYTQIYRYTYIHTHTGIHR